MSYEIARKTLSGTTFKALGSAVANFIVENVPEITLARTYTTGTYWTCYYLQWDGTKAGIGVCAYDRYSLSTTSGNDFYFFAASKISSTSGIIAHPSNAGATSLSSAYMSPAGWYTTNSASTYYTNIDVAIAKLTNGYLISFGGYALYIGYYNSPVASKKILCVNFTAERSSTYAYRGFAIIGERSDASLNYYYGPYYNFSCIYSEDGSNYNPCQAITFAPSENATTDYNAVLSPIYVVCSDIWIEPILLPDIYCMTASNYPGVFEEAKIGDVTAYRMTKHGNVVVI